MFHMHFAFCNVPAAMLRMSGSIQKSTEVMAAMQNLIKLPEIQANMMDLSREMSKAGLIEEMMEDTFESLEDDDLEEQADKEVEKVLWEVTNGVLLFIILIVFMTWLLIYSMQVN